MVRLQLVTNLEQVKQNLQQYNLELQNRQMSLNTSGVQQWYYIHELDLFGPSRYIGYADITIQKHERASYLNGGETTQALSKWFKKCDNLELYDKITNKLIDYLSQFDMDVRRNGKTRFPSFKLNLLKEELPKLEALYVYSDNLDEKAPEQTICQTCQKHFFEEPFYAHNNRGPFCSQKCLPEDMYIEIMAEEYIHYVEHYRASIISYHDISDVTMQVKFLRKLEPLLISLERFDHLEAQNDYVAFIQQLAEKLETLNKYALEYYQNSSHLEQQKAIHINWRAFGEDDFIEEQLQDLLSFIQEQLDTNTAPFTILEDIPLTIDFTKSNTLYFSSEFVSLETDQILDNIYVHITNYLNKYDLKFDLHEYVKDTIVAICPKCCNDQLLDDFAYDEDQIFCCINCQ
ncbi:hypothetical protein GAG94_08525 [Lysinibacillus sphaericus]|nr:hypothetical protein GAG94_08525 [Lysinibacillus sphaericus]